MIYYFPVKVWSLQKLSFSQTVSLQLIHLVVIFFWIFFLKTFVFDHFVPSNTHSLTHPSLSNAVKQASIAEPFGSSMTIGGVGESILWWGNVAHCTSGRIYISVQHTSSRLHPHMQQSTHTQSRASKFKKFGFRWNR